ncbi:PSME3-interacting protein-like [Corticium candelabrum]|uniref:PSME3-interacting protein-like n=1 Tax=Corticium candelabrum TaxID=121492 RepID=UPI002E277431|nr:PSME3-interacting protein-like [Corticium candelabrum]
MDTGHIKSFVTETEIEERRKRRQEEWEKVRNSDEPESCPDETDQWDGKTLYQRLQEVKEAKDLEFEEQFKFKNMIYKGLDDDEAKFLSNVSQQRAEVDRQRRETEKKFLEECRVSLKCSI